MLLYTVTASEDIRLTLQEKLRDLCEERGLKLEELSKQIGISKSALGQYENDEGKEIGHKHICMPAKGRRGKNSSGNASDTQISKNDLYKPIK